MSAGSIIRYFLLGAIAGVAIASFVVWPGMPWLIGALAASVFAVWSRQALGWYVVVFLAGMLFGVFRTESVLGQWRTATDAFVPREISGEVRIAGEWSSSGTQSTVPVDWERCEGAPCPAGRSLLTTADRIRSFSGEQLLVTCRAELPKNLRPDFDYRMYLAKDGIGSVCMASRVEPVPGTATVMTGIIRVRDTLEQRIAASVPEPESGLLEGIIFGGSGRLPKDIQQQFARTGLTHIVAVSGYNVLIVAECLLWIGILLGLWRRQAFWVALAGIWLFVLMTGAGASVLRAGIMGTLGFLSIQVGRLSSGIWLVVFAAAGMLLIDPLYFRYDLGFQLSFLATAVLVMILPLFRGRNDEGFRAAAVEIGSATLAIEVIVAPLLLSTFGYTSLVSLPANVLVLPLVPLAMFVTFLAALAGLVLPAGINVFGWVAYALGRYILTVVGTLAHLPWATLEWSISPWQVVTWYAVVGLGIYFLWRKNRRRKPDLRGV